MMPWELNLHVEAHYERRYEEHQLLAWHLAPLLSAWSGKKSKISPKKLMGNAWSYLHNPNGKR